MSIKIAITNEKGGCGKTTSAVNISAILAERGYRVLLADVDPQSYATMYYGLYNADDPSLYDAITGVWPVNDAIVKTVFGVDVLKSNTKSMRLEEMLTEYKLRGRAYNDLLSKLLTPIENDYDYIIIDVPEDFAKACISLICEITTTPLSTVRIGKQVLPSTQVCQALHSLTPEHLQAVYRITKYSNNVRKPKGYLLALLYNAAQAAPESNLYAQFFAMPPEEHKPSFDIKLYEKYDIFDYLNEERSPEHGT